MNLALSRTPAVSFVISTRNRREVLLQTIDRINACGLAENEYEIIVVDNASQDNTASALEATHPDVQVIRLGRNAGAVAKNIAIGTAIGRYVVMLDDDSFPLPGSIGRMIEHFQANPRLGCCTFTVTLPDGSRECSAYPSVFIGCGAGFRTQALDQSGGFPDDYFMQSEEYDLSLRLLDAGWDIQTFADLHVTHLKTPHARRPARTMRLDVRNNLVLAMRRFPSQHALRYARDWMARYRRIAVANGRLWAYRFGLIQGMWRCTKFWKREPVSDVTFERFARARATAEWMAEIKEQHGLRRVLFIDLGKNILPYYEAARRCGLEIVAIADTRLNGTATGTGQADYRGLPIVSDDAAAKLAFDAAVISNASPMHAVNRLADWSNLTNRPVLMLPPAASAFSHDGSISGEAAADPERPESHQTAVRSA